MKDKTQDVKSLEDLLKVVNAYSGWFSNLADELSKVLADIKAPKKEEDTWEMKCPLKDGDEYWFINDFGSVRIDRWCGCETDMDRFNIGNAFQTEEAAKLEAKRRNLLTRFRAFRNECNGDWNPDWKSHLDSKYYISFVGKAKLTIFYTGTTNNFQLFGFFKNEEDCKKAIELFGDEIIELFVEGE
nr:MAG TPA: hypothetical protein [Caudoviricetes sp.]